MADALALTTMMQCKESHCEQSIVSISKAPNFRVIWDLLYVWQCTLLIENGNKRDAFGPPEAINASALFSPWLCELRQDSITSFCDLVNRLIKKLEVAPEVYSFFPDSLLADQLVDSKRRQDAFEPLKVTNGSATVICIDNVWQWDPISAVNAYLRSASIVDQIFTRLPCSEEGHTLVDWRRLSKSRDFPSLQMILATSTSEAGRQLLMDLFLCQKQAEEIKLIQMSLIDVALNLNTPDVDKLIKSAEPFQAIPRAVFNILCQRKRYDYLPVVELAVAAAEAKAAATPEALKVGSTATSASVEGLLRRYENALMLAHSEDAASDASLLTDDDGLQHCRPILLNALRDASQLDNPDEVLLVLIRFIWLLPSRGCNPNSRANAPLINTIDSIFQTATSTASFKGSALEKFLKMHNPESMGRCLLGAAYRRHLLPAYRESVRYVGFPQLVSPVVQMFKDLTAAHHQPSAASSALQSLRHRSTVSAAGSTASDSSDPTLLSNVSKFIAMSGVVVGRRAPAPYAAPLVILVIHGTITWTLARDIVSAVTRNAPQSLEVLIVCNFLLRGRDVFHQCLL
uniref:Retrovirus Pol polyprotein from type 1 n=1 Tax=Echinococcus granulosus TaxID=6210 RepID=A0A068W7K8_ECHGR|nr:retrovirus Pol polyprotein from type 1 [Echinococcus granulosus]